MGIFARMAGAAALLTLTAGANAADLGGPSVGGYKDGPVYVESWTQPGDIFVRVRGLAVLPQDSSSGWVVGATRPSGADVSISDSVIPEIDFTYFVTKNLALELIAGVTPHTVKGTGFISGFGDVGDVWLLPPTLLLQYHFDTGTPFKPYVGAGVNYTVFFAEDSGPNYSDFKLDNNWGFALQAGFDYKLTGNWFLNFDFKYLWLDTDAHVLLNGLTPVKANVTIDPIIVGAGIGYRFGGGYEPLK